MLLKIDIVNILPHMDKVHEYFIPTSFFLKNVKMKKYFPINSVKVQYVFVQICHCCSDKL